MSATLSSLPGYGLAYAERIAQENYDAFKYIISNITQAPNVNKILDKGLFVGLGHIEVFPEALRQLALAPKFPLCVVFNPEDGKIYCDLSRVSDTAFVSEFIAECGITAFTGDAPTRKLLNSIHRAHQNISSDEERHLWNNAICRQIFEGNCVCTHNLAYHITREIFINHPNALAPENLKPLIEQTRKMLRTKRIPKAFSLWHYIALAYINIERLQHMKASNLQIDQFLWPEDKLSRPLQACAKTAPYLLPSPHWFFGLSLGRSLKKAVTVPYWFESDQTYASLTLRTPEDVVPLFEDQFKALGDVMLRPMARLNPRFLVPQTRVLEHTLQAEKEFISVEKTFLGNLAMEEASPGAIFPHFTGTQTHTFTICGISVPHTQDWATLHLNVNGIAIDALSGSWAVQGPSLRTNQVYAGALTFWVKTLNPTKNELRDKQSGYPLVTLQASTVDIFPVGKVMNTRYVAVKAKTNTGLTLNLIMPESWASTEEFQQPHHHFTVSGIYLIGNIARKSFYDTLRSYCQGISHIAQQRQYASLAAMGDASSLYLLARNMKSRTDRSKDERLRLVSIAALKHHKQAIMALAKYYLRIAHSEHYDRYAYCAYQLLMRAASLGHIPAVQLLTNPDCPVHSYTPSDLYGGLLTYLAHRTNNPSALFRIGASLVDINHPSMNREHDAVRGIDYLTQALINHTDEASYELARAYALGYSGEENPNAARMTLMLSVQRGYLPAQYWLGSFERLGKEFFNMTSDQRREVLLAGVREGVPSSQLLFGMHYEHDEPDNPDARLIAYSLYSWVEKNIHDRDAEALRTNIEKQFTEQDKEHLPLFDLWATLGITPPEISIPVRDIAGQLPDGPVMMHLPFLMCIDLIEGNKPSPRLMQLISFFAENSARVTLGLAQQEHLPPQRRLRLSAFGNTEEGASPEGDQLLVVSVRQDHTNAWDVSSVYPYFTRGTTVSTVIQGALISKNETTALLALSMLTDGKAGNTLTAFDPLWPLVRNRYRTGEIFEAIAYGVVENIQQRDSVYDGLPPEMLDVIAQRLGSEPTHESKRIVSFGCVNQENALYSINSTVRGFFPADTTIADVTFHRIEVDSFIANGMGDSTFTLYYPAIRFPGGFSVGDRIEAIFELDIYMLRSILNTGYTLN